MTRIYEVGNGKLIVSCHISPDISRNATRSSEHNNTQLCTRAVGNMASNNKHKELCACIYINGCDKCKKKY